MTRNKKMGTPERSLVVMRVMCVSGGEMPVLLPGDGG